MLATFVIGLREGLEAALIVGIIAAFLKQSNRADALRKVWAGVAAAVVLCLAVGVLLQLLSASLPQREQEMLECVVAAIAVLMVSYMILWMRAHSRDLRSDLRTATGSALASGSAGALVAMAFLAVIREGFETAVFLLAAFQSALSPVQAAIGVLLGLFVAISLGYLVYRGGVRLNLSRFFRVTGVVLVLVAAGLVMSTLRAAYEAGWLTVGQQTWLDLSVIARPGSVTESLLTGMLGIRSSLPAVEVVAYLLYAVPMLLVVLWPPRRTPSRRALGQILIGTAAGAVLFAALLALLGPAAPAAATGRQGPFDLQTAATGTGTGTAIGTGTGTGTGTAIGTATIILDGDERAAEVTVTAGGATVTGRSVLTETGHAELGGTALSSVVDAAAAGLPATMTTDQIAALNGGRLPVGLRSSQADQALAVSYLDTVTPTVSVDPDTRAVVGVDLAVRRTVQVTEPDRASVPAGAALDLALSTGPAAGAAAADRVAALADQQIAHQVLARVIPALLLVFALVLLTFGSPKLLGGRGPRTAPAERTLEKTWR